MQAYARMIRNLHALLRNLHRLPWSVCLVIAIVAGFILGACAAQEPAPVPTTAPTRDPEAALPTEPLAEVTYAEVELTGLSLTLEVPAFWQRLGLDWAWSPAEDGLPRVGVVWRDLQPPEEPEAVLPSPSQVLDSEPIDLGWASGRRVTLEVYAPGPGTGDTQAPAQSVQAHVLLVVQDGSIRRAYDLFAAATSAADLEAIEPIFQHMLDTISVEREEAAATPAAEPVVPSAEVVAVTVYFGNSELNPSIQDCGLVYPVVRLVPMATVTGTDSDLALAEAALGELFAGPTAAEAEQGYVSMFSAETASILKGIKVEGKTAYVHLADIRQVIPSAGTSCGSQAFLAEVGNTVQGVLPVERVLYAIEGDPAAFYDWMQFGCSAENDFCDPAPFVVEDEG